jgi:hypothetical protein
MGYKHESMAGNGERTRATLSKTQIFLADLTLPYGRVIHDCNTQNFVAPLGGDSLGHLG